MEKKLGIIFILVVGIFISLNFTLFILDEGEQAIITQFGRPIGSPKMTAGPYLKLPWQDVHRLDKKILSWDGDPNQIPTKDKKYISVDTTARWKIINPLRFIETVQNMHGAQMRLNDIIDAITRDTISNNNLVEAVRNTNDILDYINEKSANPVEGQSVENTEVIGEIEKIKVGREKLSEIIAKKADEELKQYGITVIDVQLRRIAYEESVEAKVYERMISERQRIAEKIRSIGKGEQAKIEGRMSRDLQAIESEAYRKAEIVKGEAESKAIAIYAESFSADPKFYEFIKTMDAYKRSLKKNTEFIMSTESDFLQFMIRK